MSQREKLFQNLGKCKSGPIKQTHKVIRGLGTQRRSFSNAYFEGSGLWHKGMDGGAAVSGPGEVDTVSCSCDEPWTD